MPRLRLPRVLGFRLEVLSWKTCEWSVAYQGIDRSFTPAIYRATMEAAIKDPEVLEVKLVKTHDAPGTFSSLDSIDKYEVEALPEPVVVQHVKLHWRRGRT